jgi:hypothetical protein
MRFEYLTEEDAVWLVGGSMLLDRDEMLRYNQNPDLFMAQAMGFETAERYLEYLDSHGAALCGGTTKSGAPCKAVVRYCSGPEQFQELHRKALCHVHGPSPCAP